MTNVKKQLTYLEAVGLIRLAKTHPELEFMFRHALVQEAAYNSLLFEDRKKLHLKVGEVIEQTYPDQVASGEMAPVLADHFAKAGDDQRALKYFTLAGDAEAAVYANSEAVEHYSNALEIAGRIKASNEELTHLYTRLGRAQELSIQYEKALHTYEDMETVAGVRGDGTMELTALMARVTLHATPSTVHDPIQGRTLEKQALTLAQKLGNQETEAKLLWNLLNLYRFSDQVLKAIEYGERSLALARNLNLWEQIAFILTDLTYCYVTTGHFDQAKDSIGEAIGLWRNLDNVHMLTDSLATSAYVYAYAGEYNQVLIFSEEAFQISQSINNLWGLSFSLFAVGQTYWEHGQINRAISVMEDSIKRSKLANYVTPQVLTRADLAALYSSLGDIETGLNTAGLALNTAEAQLPTFRGYVLGILAQLHILNDNLYEAKIVIDEGREDSYAEAHLYFFMPVLIAESQLALAQNNYERTLTTAESLLATLRQFGTRAHIPYVLYLQSQAFLGMGQHEVAGDHLREARAEAETLGSRRTLWKILATLAEVETDPAKADTLRQQAREIIEHIADHTPADLRASFLNLPEVRAVLEG